MFCVVFFSFFVICLTCETREHFIERPFEIKEHVIFKYFTFLKNDQAIKTG